MKKRQKTNLRVVCRRQFDDSQEYPFCQMHHLPHERVGDALCEEVDEWVPSCPVLIDAPTGLGKSTFVYEAILPRAIEQQKNVLILSNRVALANQQKLYVMKALDSPLKDLLTEKGVQEQTLFGSVGVLTYHRLPGFLNDGANTAWINNLAYVICDECHFFTSDSSFNCNVNWILKLITSKFCSAIRIYMSATPWDAIHPISEAEQKNYRDFSRTWLVSNRPLFIEPRSMLYYSFARDFNHVNLQFFDKMEEIVMKINESTDEKWVVFMDNKEKAAELMEAIEVPTTYLDAESKGMKDWSDLIRNEKFNSTVLLTTSVLDCGVNINDPQLKNVVIISDNRVSIMQMAGRKRCRDGETVNIWIQELSKAKLSNRSQRVTTYLAQENEYDNLLTEEDRKKFIRQIWHWEDATVRNLFTVTLHSVRKSMCGFIYMHRLNRFYRRLLDGEITFREAVEKWFEKESPPTESELDLFFQAHRDAVLTEEERDELRRIIASAYKRAGFSEAQPKRAGVLKHTALNNRLQELNLPYQIEAVGNNWKLIFVGSSENEEDKPYET